MTRSGPFCLPHGMWCRRQPTCDAGILCGATRPRARRGGKSSARARHQPRPVISERTRTGAETRRQRRRNVVKRAAAIGASLRRQIEQAKPAAARGTFGIEALNHATRQRGHRPSQERRWGRRRRESASHKRVMADSWAVYTGDCARGSLVCQEKTPQPIGVVFHPRKISAGRRNLQSVFVSWVLLNSAEVPDLGSRRLASRNSHRCHRPLAEPKSRSAEEPRAARRISRRARR